MIYKLLRKQEAFFSTFGELARLAVEAAGEFRQLLDSHPTCEAHADRISDLESQGDDLIENLNRHLASTFITPIDREDIHHMANSLDSVIDFIHGSAHRVVSYRVERIPDAYHELVGLVVSSTQAIEKGLACLQSGDEIAAFRKQVKKDEKKSDTVSRQAIGDLFAERVDVYELLKWKELYERLESTLDRCEDVFDTLDALVVKYA